MNNCSEISFWSKWGLTFAQEEALSRIDSEAWDNTKTYIAQVDIVSFSWKVWRAKNPSIGAEPWNIAGEWKDISERPINTFLIESESDFPNQDATTITLENWLYTIADVIATFKRFVVPDWHAVSINSTSAFLWWLFYGWAWAMFTWNVIIALDFNETFVTCPLWTLFNINGGGQAQVFITNTVIFDVVNLWNLSNLVQFTGYFNAINDIWIWFNCDSVDIVWFIESRYDEWRNVGTSIFTFNWTMSSIAFWFNEFKPKSNDFIFDFKSTLILKNATINWCSYNKDSGWGLFAPWSKTQVDPEFKFTGNSKMPDSVADTELSLRDNLTNTIINVINTPELVAGVWVDSAQRFTTTASGRATYTWFEDISLSIRANPTILLDTWTNKNVTCCFSIWNDVLNTIVSIIDQWGWIIRFTTWNAHWLSTWDRVPITNTTSYNKTYTITVIDANNFDVTEVFVASETGNWQIIIEKSWAQTQIASTTKSSQLTIFTGYVFVTNDFAELFIENNFDATNLLVTNANFLIS